MLNKWEAVLSQSSELRQLSPKDWHEFKKIRLEALKKEPQAFGASYEEISIKKDSFFKDSIDKAIIVGAFVDGEIIGIAGFYTDEAIKCRHVGNIWGVYVSNPHRNCGKAKELFEKILSLLPSGVEQVRLSVGAHSPAAKALYLSFGFQECGLEEKVLKVNNQYYDEILMVKFIK